MVTRLELWNQYLHVQKAGSCGLLAQAIHLADLKLPKVNPISHQETKVHTAIQLFILDQGHGKRMQQEASFASPQFIGDLMGSFICLQLHKAVYSGGVSNQGCMQIAGQLGSQCLGCVCSGHSEGKPSTLLHVSPETHHQSVKC